MNVKLEEQLKVLQVCGIKLRPDITIDNLLSEFDREEYENDPYILLLTVLGGEFENEEGVFELVSDDVWHFDTECIEDHGDYIAIAQRMSDLARGALPLEDINDYVDVIDEGKAWLSFKVDGKQTKWVADVENDWVDANIMSLFAELLAQRNTGKLFTYLDLGGQDCIIGCCTSNQLAMLKNTGLNIQWLS